jgi:hypothetical protein
MGTLGQILYAINPKSVDYILNSAYHLFPDSSAARGEKDAKGGKDEAARGEKGERPAERQRTAKPAEKEHVSREQMAFAYLMRGVHW